LKLHFAQVSHRASAQLSQEACDTTLCNTLTLNLGYWGMIAWECNGEQALW